LPSCHIPARLSVQILVFDQTFLDDQSDQLRFGAKLDVCANQLAGGRPTSRVETSARAAQVLEVAPFFVKQDQETPTMVINLQSYGLPSIQFRRNTLRFVRFIQKRVRLWRCYGPQIALAFEFQRFTGNTRLSSPDWLTQET
jgi:hypothetical protein